MEDNKAGQVKSESGKGLKLIDIMEAKEYFRAGVEWDFELKWGSPVMIFHLGRMDLIYFVEPGAKKGRSGLIN